MLKIRAFKRCKELYAEGKDEHDITLILELELDRRVRLNAVRSILRDIRNGKTIPSSD